MKKILAALVILAAAASGLSAAVTHGKTAGTVAQSFHEPLESHGNLVEPPSQPLGHPVDERAGHQGLSHHGVRRPSWAMAEEVRHRHRQIGVGVQKPRRRGDDAVTVVVRIIAKSHAEAVSEGDEARHGKGR